jgi:hypothetical protein
MRLAWRSWVDRSLSGGQCVIGWMAATAVFFGLTSLVGGATENDASESLYSTWAIAHGRFACAFAPGTAHHFAPIARPGPFIAPLYPLLSGAVAAVTHIGGSVPYPSQSALGSNCSTALVATYRWAVQSGAAAPTVRIGFVGWFVLMAGVILALRAFGRGRCGWEPATLVLIACVPTVFAPVANFFHPQDLVATGLIFAGLAFARKERWVWAGVLFGLAITSQQFALLVFIPVLVLAPRTMRLRCFVGTSVAVGLLVIPLAAVTEGRVLRAVVIGSGNSPSFGGMWVSEVHLHGAALVFLSRIVPLFISAALAQLAVRKLGNQVFEPIPLMSITATSLSLRLVFEQNMFSYYFMALAVSLVVLDVVGGRIRGKVVVWIGLVTLALDPVPLGFFSNGKPWGAQIHQYLPLAFMVVSLVMIVADLLRGRFRWYLVASFLLVVMVFANFPPWANVGRREVFPVWFWQLVLVPTGFALAVRPLVRFVKHRPEPTQLPAKPLVAVP